MLIRGRRIRTLGRHIHGVPRGEPVVVGLTDIDRFAEVLQVIGFSAEMEDGETVLPPVGFGSISRYNAEGKYDIHRDQPMETAYRTMEWQWQEWHGDDRVEQTKVVDVPYQRYPRTLIPPPSVEMTLATTTDGSRVVRTPAIEYNETNDSHMLHVVNLFLEIFGECSPLQADLVEFLNVPVRRLNWNVLPPGRRPWAQLRQEIDPVVRETPVGNQSLIWQRLQSVNTYEPAFLAVGRGGFRGYVVFGFPDRDIYVLECIHHGNATYVFDGNWEALSQMTKATILTGGLHRSRLIHRANWSGELRDVMRS